MRRRPVTARQRMEARRRTQAVAGCRRWGKLRREARDKLHAWWFERMTASLLADVQPVEATGKLSLADLDRAINYLRSRG